MVHARRMFIEALDNDEDRATHALEEIQKVYTIEQICKESNLNFEEL